MRSTETSMNSVNKLQSQYSSRYHNATQKDWEMKKGAVACSANSALNAGRGISSICDNKSAMLDEDGPLGLFFAAPSCAPASSW